MISQVGEEIAAISGRGVRATWWYTFASMMFFSAVMVIVWAAPVAARHDAPAGWLIGYAIGCLLWLVSFGLIAFAYRDETAGRSTRGRRVIVFCLAAIGAAAAAWTVGSVTLGLSMVCALVCALPWPRGPRGRVTLLLTVVLLGVAWIEFARSVEALAEGNARDATAYGMLYAYPVVLPFMTVSVLWWWDIVRALDAARLAHGRLAAAQERLRVANDVHDLQGHHLQVIALQLELADRLLDRDPDAARDHVRTAQRAVDDARTGTRELATEVRTVPLPDELANAADLLQAAGMEVDLVVAAGAERAPAGILGPVVRECTTNILRHGLRDAAARLSLTRDGSGWVFRAENRMPDVDHSGEGTGLRGMAERVRAAGGDFAAESDGDRFTVTARVPGEAS